MRRAEKKEWAEKTLRQLLDLNISWKKVVFLAGSAYREFLENPLLESGITQEIEVPLKGFRHRSAKSETERAYLKNRNSCHC